jgi:hypothetical protein
MPLTVLNIWWVLANARNAGPGSAAIAAPLLVALLWGCLWVWQPNLAALRLLPPPGGQAAAILSLVVGLNLLMFLPSVRQYFRSVNLRDLVPLGVWRLIYGTGLLAIGLTGGLPAAFFWSAAFGDIAVGIWAIAIMARRSQTSLGELITWNIVGALDLLHVLALGAINLGLFYAAHPEMPLLNLLPLVGVPLLLVLHILSLRGVYMNRFAPLPSPAIGADRRFDEPRNQPTNSKANR